MRRWLVVLVGTLLFSTLLVATPRVLSKPTLVCTLTNTNVEMCCCQLKEGKLYCPLAKKTIEKCCCVAADGR